MPRGLFIGTVCLIIITTLSLTLANSAMADSHSSSAENPGARYGHVILYSEQHAGLILFGGFREDRTLLNDTWLFKDGTWTQIAREKAPSPRKWPGMAVNPETGDILLFGGRVVTDQGELPNAETWLLDDDGWHQLDAGGPAARDHHSIAFDNNLGALVMFGGWDGADMLGDTWVFNRQSGGQSDGKWELLANEGPIARAAFGLAYSATAGGTILFGGRTADTFLYDSWLLRNGKWQRLETRHSPPPRSFHGLTANTSNGKLITFSGRSGDHLYTDTWTFDGQDWAITNDNGPRRRGVFSLAYDPTLDAAVFYGGGLLENRQWTLEAGLWELKDGIWQRLD